MMNTFNNKIRKIKFKSDHSYGRVYVVTAIYDAIRKSECELIDIHITTRSHRDVIGWVKVRDNLKSVVEFKLLLVGSGKFEVVK